MSRRRIPKRMSRRRLRGGSNEHLATDTQEYQGSLCNGQIDSVSLENIDPRYAIRLEDAPGHYRCYDVRSIKVVYERGNKQHPETRAPITPYQAFSINRKLEKLATINDTDGRPLLTPQQAAPINWVFPSSEGRQQEMTRGIRLVDIRSAPQAPIPRQNLGPNELAARDTFTTIVNGILNSNRHSNLELTVFSPENDYDPFLDTNDPEPEDMPFQIRIGYTTTVNNRRTQIKCIAIIKCYVMDLFNSIHTTMSNLFGRYETDNEGSMIEYTIPANAELQ